MNPQAGWVYLLPHGASVAVPASDGLGQAAGMLGTSLVQDLALLTGDETAWQMLPAPTSCEVVPVFGEDWQPRVMSGTHDIRFEPSPPPPAHATPAALPTSYWQESPGEGGWGLQCADRTSEGQAFAPNQDAPWSTVPSPSNGLSAAVLGAAAADMWKGWLGGGCLGPAQASGLLATQQQQPQRTDEGDAGVPEACGLQGAAAACDGRHAGLSPHSVQMGVGREGAGGGQQVQAEEEEGGKGLEVELASRARHAGHGVSEEEPPGLAQNPCLEGGYGLREELEAKGEMASMQPLHHEGQRKQCLFELQKEDGGLGMHRSNRRDEEVEEQQQKVMQSSQMLEQGQEQLLLGHNKQQMHAREGEQEQDEGLRVTEQQRRQQRQYLQQQNELKKKALPPLMAMLERASSDLRQPEAVLFWKKRV